MIRLAWMILVLSLCDVGGFSANLEYALQESIGPVSRLDAVHVAERAVAGFEVTTVTSDNSMGLELYAIEGQAASQEMTVYVHPDTARVYALSRKGVGMEMRNGVLAAAHRGANYAAPENTLAAIRKAVELGADIVEMDVRQTKDGHLILMHNATVSHTTNGQGKVNNLTLEQIKALDAGSWFGEEFTGERVPTLEEALDVIRGKAAADFDLKSATPEVFIRALHAEFEKAPTFFERTAMYCSNLSLRAKVLDLEPRLRIRPALQNGVQGLPALLSQYNKPLINIEWSDFSEDLIRQVHLAGCQAVVNTHGPHDTPPEICHAIGAGADIIMTGRLDILVPLLREKGVHP